MIYTAAKNEYDKASKKLCSVNDDNSSDIRS